MSAEHEIAALREEIAGLKYMLQRFSLGSPEMIPRELAEAVAFRGDDANALYRAFAGTEYPVCKGPPAAVGFTSSLCHQAHFMLDQYRYWSQAMKWPPRFHRKQWEFVYIAQALHERGLLAPGKRGLVFGAGQEPLPAMFATFGARILATDQAAESAAAGGWAATAESHTNLAALNRLGICPEQTFRELVSYASVDMNQIPEEFHDRFDFCWSSCALEHLGSLRHGFNFIENSMKTLKPGGVAVHTTEFNVSSNEDTFEAPDCCFYRRRDIDDFMREMSEKGFVVSPIDWSLGEGFAEKVVDLPPYGRGEPHIRLKSRGYDTTSVGLIISRPQDVARREVAGSQRRLGGVLRRAIGGIGADGSS